MLPFNPSSAVFAFTLGVILAASYAFGQFLTGRSVPPASQSGDVVASSGATMIRVVESGTLSGGYLDGRPVPSGFKTPMVIRWHAVPDEPHRIDEPFRAGVTP
jgi:hypothetical protein